MIRINLLPPSAQSAAAKTLSLDLPLRPIGMGVGVLVLVVSVGLIVSQRNSTAALQHLTREWEDLGGRRMELEGVQQSLRALGSRAAVMENVKGDKAKWAPRLNLLTDALVANLWFTRLRFGDVGVGGDLEDPFAQALPEGMGSELQLEELPPEFVEGAEAPPEELGSEAGEDLDVMFAAWGGGAAPDSTPQAAPPPELVLEGSTLVTETGAGSSVRRFLQRLKEHPEFERWFERVELKAVEHRQIGHLQDAGGIAFEGYDDEEETSTTSPQALGQTYEVSDFVIVFRPVVGE